MKRLIEALRRIMANDVNREKKHIGLDENADLLIPKKSSRATSGVEIENK